MTKKRVSTDSPAAGRLTISRLTAKGVLGIEESTIDLDTITVLAGSNGTAKSSHLAAIRSALGIDRTSLARLARIENGTAEEAPMVEVILVGEDREVLVSRKGGESPEVRERVGEDWRKVPRPVEWLRNLIDVQAANPALWLAMKDEDLAAALLEAMPLPAYSRSDAMAAAGLPDFRLPPIPAGLHPLEELEQIEAAIFSARTEVNRQERTEHDAATKLLSGLPAEAPVDASVRIERGDAEVSALAAEIARQDSEADAAERAASLDAERTRNEGEARITADFKLSAAKLRTEHEQRAAEIRAAAERRVAELAAEMETAIDAMRTRGEEGIRQFDQAWTEACVAAAQAHEKARAAIQVKRQNLQAGRELLATLRAQQSAIETDRHVRATAQEAKAKAAQHEERALVLTHALEALKRYKLKLASQLPIPGLAVQFSDGGKKSLTLDGVPLAQVNDGRRAELATEVSLLRSRPPEDGRPYLPLVLLDGIEKLDPSRRVALLREVAARGTQIIAACVVSDPMKVLRGEDALHLTADLPPEVRA